MPEKVVIGNAELWHGDCLATLRNMPDKSAQTCVTSPPYFGLRDYGHDGQIGLEPTPDEYVTKMVDVFREVRRVLADDGTLWLNLGDSYTGSAKSGGANQNNGGPMYRGETLPTKRSPGLKPKDLIGIPWRVAFALQTDGWYLRQDIIWHKPNPMPESVRDRCTKAHEYIFLLSKSERYFFDSEAMKEQAVGSAGGAPRKIHDPAAQGKHGATSALNAPWTPSETRNRRSVWTVATRPYKGAHFAAFPPDLIKPCILAGSRPGDVVLDPFTGSGTTGSVALKHGRRFVGCELNHDYIALAVQRIIESQQIPQQKTEAPKQTGLFEATAIANPEPIEKSKPSGGGSGA